MNAAVLLLSSTLGVGGDAPGPGCRGGDCARGAAVAGPPPCGLGEDCEKKRTGIARLVPPPRKQPPPKDPCPGCDDQPKGLLGVIVKGPKKPAAKDPCPGCDKPRPPATLVDAMKNHRHHKGGHGDAAHHDAIPAEMGPAAAAPPQPLPTALPPKPAAPVTPASGPRLNGPHSPY